MKYPYPNAQAYEQELARRRAEEKRRCAELKHLQDTIEAKKTRLATLYQTSNSARELREDIAKLEFMIAVQQVRDMYERD